MLSKSISSTVFRAEKRQKMTGMKKEISYYQGSSKLNTIGLFLSAPVAYHIPAWNHQGLFFV